MVRRVLLGLLCVVLIFFHSQNVDGQSQYPPTQSQLGGASDTVFFTLDLESTDFTRVCTGIVCTYTLLTTVSKLGQTIEGTELNTTFDVPSGTTIDWGTAGGVFLPPQRTTGNCPTTQASGCYNTSLDEYGFGDGSAFVPLKGYAVYTYHDFSVGVGVTKFFPPNSNYGTEDPQTTSAVASIPVPAQTCVAIHCKAHDHGSSATTGSGVRTTLCVNDVCTDTALQCDATFTDSGPNEEVFGDDTTGTITYAEGDEMTIKAATINTPGSVRVFGSVLCRLD